MKIIIIVIGLIMVSMLIGSVIFYGQNTLKNRRKQSDRRNINVFMDSALERRRNLPNRRKQLAREVK